MAGRKTDLASPETRDAVLTALRTGLTDRAACAIARVGLSTFYEWIQRGEGRSSRPASDIYAQFVEDVVDARDQGAANCELTLAKAARRDWRAALAWLERRRPEDWSRNRTEETPEPVSDDARIRSVDEFLDRQTG